MSDVTEMLDGFDYFDEQDKEWGGITPEGKYKAQIVEVDIKHDHESIARKDRTKKNVSNIYEVTYKIHSDNAKESFKDNEGTEVQGGSLVDRTVKGRRVYKFKTPTTEQSNNGFIANPGNNGGYFKFCTAVNAKIEEKEITIPAGQRTVKILPDLTKEDLLGKPVIITVKHRVWKGKDGKEIIIESTGKPGRSAEVYDVQEWNDGPVDEAAAIPF